jgi:hypothetical protein
MSKQEDDEDEFGLRAFKLLEQVDFTDCVDDEAPDSAPGLVWARWVDNHLHLVRTIMVERWDGVDKVVDRMTVAYHAGRSSKNYSGNYDVVYEIQKIDGEETPRLIDPRHLKVFLPVLQRLMLLEDLADV